MDLNYSEAEIEEYDRIAASSLTAPMKKEKKAKCPFGFGKDKKPGDSSSLPFAHPKLS